LNQHGFVFKYLAIKKYLYLVKNSKFFRIHPPHSDNHQKNHCKSIFCKISVKKIHGDHPVNIHHNIFFLKAFED